MTQPSPLPSIPDDEALLGITPKQTTFQRAQTTSADFAAYLSHLAAY
jgi:hypothetical protein